MKTFAAFVLSVVLFAPTGASAQIERCAQPLSTGPLPIASDCLYILRAAVELETPDPECMAAPTGTLPIKATDSLLCLNASVGLPVSLDCVCDFVTTSTTTTTVTLPAGDDDNDGIENNDDPCPTDPRNRCIGEIATDGNTGRNIRINTVNPRDFNLSCRGQRIDCAGDVWEGDFGVNHQSHAFECDLAGDACEIGGLESIFGCRDDNTNDILRCEHFGSPEYSDLVWSFDVPNGSYVVNLLFANVFHGTATVGSRVFDVAIEGQLVLTDFDQVAAAGGSGRAVVRSLLVDVVDGDGLQIEFLPIIENPAIKGIEVLKIVN